jgi:HAD domain in Swiss Army Knife RNA repair proteins
VILFLDLDGVLHPDAAYLVKGRPTLKGEGKLFMWAPLLIKALADFLEVQIVLSMSWARELSFNRARHWLPEQLRACVVGSTWHSALSIKRESFRGLATWWDEATRYQQIKRYAARAGLTDWLAIDDQPEGWGADDLDKLVQTDSDTGLSDPVVLAVRAARLQVLGKSQTC